MKGRSSEVKRWLNYQVQTRQTGTVKTDKRLAALGSVSFVSSTLAIETTEIGVMAEGQRTPRLSSEMKVDKYGPSWPSPENAVRPVEERLKEARALLAWLSDFYNRRISVLEHQDCLPADEAHRRAIKETQATEEYRRWRALG